VHAKNQNLVLRIVSSAVLLPLILYLVLKGGWYTAGLTSVSAAIVTSEYYQITMKRLSPAGWVGIVVSAALPLFPVLTTTTRLTARAVEHSADLGFWWVAGFFFFAWTYHLIRGPLADAPTLCAQLLTGILYGALGMTALAEMRGRTSGVSWIVTTFTVTWANDTCAYFAGRFFGKHKLYPEVSPNKTWEGFAGGMVGSVAGLFIYRAFWDTPLTMVDCVVLGIAGAIVGPIGDLAESMLKRAYGVKDSGTLIPGHGGLLDRVDALLFNAPMVFMYMHFIRGIR
jgi:phosphatidate cytidylyltransferase